MCDKIKIKVHLLGFSQYNILVFTLLRTCIFPFFVSLDICVYNFDGQDILGWRGSVVLFDLVLQKVIFLVLFKIIFILN